MFPIGNYHNMCFQEVVIKNPNSVDDEYNGMEEEVSWNGGLELRLEKGTPTGEKKLPNGSVVQKSLQLGQHISYGGSSFLNNNLGLCYIGRSSLQRKL